MKVDVEADYFRSCCFEISLIMFIYLPPLYLRRHDIDDIYCAAAALSLMPTRAATITP